MSFGIVWSSKNRKREVAGTGGWYGFFMQYLSCFCVCLRTDAQNEVILFLSALPAVACKKGGGALLWLFRVNGSWEAQRCSIFESKKLYVFSWSLLKGHLTVVVLLPCKEIFWNESVKYVNWKKNRNFSHYACFF